MAAVTRPQCLLLGTKGGKTVRSGSSSSKAQLSTMPALAALARPQPRRLRAEQLTCRAAEAPAAADTEQEQEEQQPAVQKPQLVTPDWARAVELQQKGEVFETQVIAAKPAGVTVEVGKLQGFIPYKLMDPARLAAAEQQQGGGSAAGAPEDKEAAMMQRQKARQLLVGQKLNVKVTQVIVPERRLICSEKAAMLDVLCSQLRKGDVVDGVVSSLHDFGALVSITAVNGQPAPSGQVCLPLRELSWDWVSNTSDVVQRGQQVRCTVVRVDAPPRSRVTVSLKRLQKDPLKETLDVLLPLDGAATGAKALTEVPAGVEDILEALRREPGITDVTLGRTVTEKRTVSQDLEVWMTKEEVAGGFNLVARAGRLVQEIRVATAMSSDEMKAVVQRVLRSLV